MMTSECAEEEDEKVKDIGLSVRFDCISFLEQMAPNTMEEDIELCFTKLEYRQIFSSSDSNFASK